MNRLRRLLHRHRWTTIDATHGANGFGNAVTVLLRQCACDDYSTETLNGHWPRELFIPPANHQGE